MKLTLRFYEPTAGRVLLDGTPLHGMSNAELRSQVAWVPQEPPLFPVSVREVRVSNPTPNPTLTLGLVTLPLPLTLTLTLTR